MVFSVNGRKRLLTILIPPFGYISRILVAKPQFLRFSKTGEEVSGVGKERLGFLTAGGEVLLCFFYSIIIRIKTRIV